MNCKRSEESNNKRGQRYEKETFNRYNLSGDDDAVFTRDTVTKLYR